MKIGIDSVSVRFGAVTAVNGVTLEIASGERRALIGPNGAGKTSLFNAISGDVSLSRGRVTFDDRDVTGLASWRRARAGLGRTFQRSTLFPQLTVLENLAQALRGRAGGWRFWPTRDERALEREALLLDEPMAGLAGAERRAALERLRALPGEVTIVIVEHDLDAVFAVAERITVLDHGVVIADGAPEAVRADARVQEVYMGHAG